MLDPVQAELDMHVDQVQNAPYRSMLRALKCRSLIFPAFSQCQLFFFFSHFRVTEKPAQLFEIIFTFHCHLEEKAFANETGELIWSAWD